MSPALDTCFNAQSISTNTTVPNIDISSRGAHIQSSTRIEPRLTYWNPEESPVSIVSFATTSIALLNSDTRVEIESTAENTVVKITIYHLGYSETLHVAGLEHSHQNH